MLSLSQAMACDINQSKWLDESDYCSECDDGIENAFKPKELVFDPQTDTHYLPKFPANYTHSIVNEHMRMEGLQYSKRVPFSQLKKSFNLENRDAIVYWMFSITQDLHLSHHTFALATKLFDRLLLNSQIPDEEYNTYAATCMFIAFKLEEEDVTDFCQLIPNYISHVTESRIIRSELAILTKLQFQMKSITPYSYLDLMLPNLMSENTPERNFKINGLCKAAIYSFMMSSDSLKYTSYEIAQSTYNLIQDLMEKIHRTNAPTCQKEIYDSLVLSFSEHGPMVSIFPYLCEFFGI